MFSKTLLAAALAATTTAGLAGTAHAQNDDCTPSRLMVVLDKSSSMINNLEGAPKWETAVSALGDVASAYENEIQLGLNVFPAAGQCSPGEVVVEPTFGARAQIDAALAEPPPAGGYWTPMAETLDAVALEPSLNDPNVASYVVLITDGWQWCDPYDPGTRFAPVDAVQRLNQAGITTFVVGFGDGVDVETLNQMATAAGTDRANCDPTSADAARDDNCYYQADSPAELVAALMDVAQQIPDQEICDGIDNDCDGEIDEDLVRDCSSACGGGTSVCSAGEWTECDAPAAEEEVCDGVDNDCDGEADDGDDLCGPNAYCDGECIPMGEDAPAGCGCEAGDGSGWAGGLIPMLLALGWIGLGRRRREP